jgi:hypothetical protein
MHAHTHTHTHTLQFTTARTHARTSAPKHTHCSALQQACTIALARTHYSTLQHARTLLHAHTHTHSSPLQHTPCVLSPLRFTWTLVTAISSGHFLSSGFPNCPCTLATAVLMWLFTATTSSRRHCRLNLRLPFVMAVSSQLNLKQELYCCRQSVCRPILASGNHWDQQPIFVLSWKYFYAVRSKLMKGAVCNEMLGLYLTAVAGFRRLYLSGASISRTHGSPNIEWQPYVYIRFEVFTAVTMKNVVFWVVTPCGSFKNRRFGGTWRLLHQGDKNRWTRNNKLQLATDVRSVQGLSEPHSRPTPIQKIW